MQFFGHVAIDGATEDDRHAERLERPGALVDQARAESRVMLRLGAFCSPPRFSS